MSDEHKKVSLGVGSGDGCLFVYGDYDSIKECQAKIFRMERAEQRAQALEARVRELEAEVEKARPFVVTLQQQLAEQRALADRLKLEAECHAQEARSQRSTVHEIYQIITDGKGEPGDWNGAEPVRKWIAEQRVELERLKKVKHGFMWDDGYKTGFTAALAQAKAQANAALDGLREALKDYVRAFESDFVDEGVIVDQPEWEPATTFYVLAKTALAQANAALGVKE